MQFVWMGFLKSSDPIQPELQQQISGFLQQPYIHIENAGVLRNAEGGRYDLGNAGDMPSLLRHEGGQRRQRVGRQLAVGIVLDQDQTVAPHDGGQP